MNVLPTADAAATRARRGYSAASPQRRYEPEPPVRSGSAGLEVFFEGEDGRRRRYPVASLPLPGLHVDLAAAFARRCGPTGGRRTLSSADSVWRGLRRLVTFLATLPRPPAYVGDLSVSHLRRFRLHMSVRLSECWLSVALAEVRLLLLEIQPVERLQPELRDFLGQRGHMTAGGKPGGVPGYSDAEFNAIMAAARSDAVAIRARIAAGERLLELASHDPGRVAPADRARAALLVELAQPAPDAGPGAAGNRPARRWVVAADASVLFVTTADLAPLVILAVGLTGWNGETVKELPAQHRLLEGRAVAVGLTKRRRGKTHSRHGVHWEVDTRASRQLHTPGSYYLLLHELMRRSRALSGTPRLWSIWVGSARTAARHVDPFAARLGRGLNLGGWAVRHGLTDDDGNPLQLTLNRLKTSVEVRTARAVGGHLPSAVRTNSMDVSFQHYLRNDPRIRDWADRILTAALTDAHRHAREFTARVLATAEAALAAQAQPDGLAEAIHRAAAGDLDTLATSCLDIDHSPFNDGRCTASFLLCLRCPNALVLERHLPMLLALVDWLQAELAGTDVDSWIGKHGQTWLILTEVILPRFTAAQRQRAAQHKPAHTALGLLEGPAHP